MKPGWLDKITALTEMNVDGRKAIVTTAIVFMVALSFFADMPSSFVTLLSLWVMRLYAFD
jgi:hypothetical protein